MGKAELDNLVKIGQLKVEAVTRAEFDGMINGAKKRLADAQNKDLASESRFDLTYGAASWFRARGIEAERLPVGKTLYCFPGARPYDRGSRSRGRPDIRQSSQ